MQWLDDTPEALHFELGPSGHSPTLATHWHIFNLGVVHLKSSVTQQLRGWFSTSNTRTVEWWIPYTQSGVGEVSCHVNVSEIKHTAFLLKYHIINCKITLYYAEWRRRCQTQMSIGQIAHVHLWAGCEKSAVNLSAVIYETQCQG